MPLHLQVKLLTLLLWFACVYVHELGHAVTAYVGGDSGVPKRGGFSPIRIWFTSPFLSLVLPLVALLYGGLPLPGAAVQIDRSALRSKPWIALTYLAGPGGTVLATLALLAAYLGMVAAGGGWEPLRLALAFVIVLNVMSCLINLAPIPPLDGYGVATSWMEGEALKRAWRVAPYAMVGVFVLLFNVPALSGWLWVTSLKAGVLGGVDRADFQEALQLAIFTSWFARG